VAGEILGVPPQGAKPSMAKVKKLVGTTGYADALADFEASLEAYNRKTQEFSEACSLFMRGGSANAEPSHEHFLKYRREGSSMLARKCAQTALGAVQKTKEGHISRATLMQLAMMDCKVCVHKRTSCLLWVSLFKLLREGEGCPCNTSSLSQKR